MDRPALPNLLEYARELQAESGLGWDEFLQRDSHLLRRRIIDEYEQQRDSLRIANTSGDPLVRSVSLYHVRDHAAALAALRKKLGAQDEDGAFVWIEEDGKGGSTVFGRAEIDGDALRLECNSRERLRRIRKMMEKAAGLAIRHREDTFDSMQTREEISRLREKLGAPKPEANPIDPEMERQIISEYYGRHYATWPDQPLPALDGKTPRNAMKTPRGRAQVVELLKTMEVHAARERAQGRYNYDFSKLRRELGIGELD